MSARWREPNVDGERSVRTASMASSIAASGSTSSAPADAAASASASACVWSRSASARSASASAAAAWALASSNSAFASSSSALPRSASARDRSLSAACCCSVADCCRDLGSLVRPFRSVPGPHDCEDRHERQDEQSGDRPQQDTQSPDAPPIGSVGRVEPVESGTQERLLGRRQSLRSPFHQRCRCDESGSREQLIVVAAAAVPLGCCAPDERHRAPRLDVFGDPLGQSRPSVDQRLVRDLDRRLARVRVAIEHDEPGMGESLRQRGRQRGRPRARRVRSTMRAYGSARPRRPSRAGRIPAARRRAGQRPVRRRSPQARAAIAPTSPPS